MFRKLLQPHTHTHSHPVYGADGRWRVFAYEVVRRFLTSRIPFVPANKRSLRKDPIPFQYTHLVRWSDGRKVFLFVLPSSNSSRLLAGNGGLVVVAVRRCGTVIRNPLNSRTPTEGRGEEGGGGGTTYSYSLCLIELPRSCRRPDCAIPSVVEVARAYDTFINVSMRVIGYVDGITPSPSGFSIFVRE